MGQARKKYTQEYKDEAVELVISSGRPIAEIARNLGINEGTLANWVNTAKKSGKLKEKPLDTDERAELRELRDENRRLRMERDFLGSAPGPRSSPRWTGRTTASHARKDSRLYSCARCWRYHGRGITRGRSARRQRGREKT